MARTIIIQAEEQVVCPECNHRFQLTEGISRQAIERHAGELERSLAEHKKKLEAQVGREAQWKAQLESAQREAADLKRKLEQGSQQLQGEALELSLEAMLKGAFPLDEILPVPKGVNGADLIQRVRSPSGLVCGTILWEAKH